ncbi:MAG: hypothetical protein QG664_853 [Patescibacteria group bacterium]|nr:hypothetical protein [Patescibacteria group bacterium]
MSLKLLAIPFFVICTLVIAISYVKPDVVLLFEKHRRLGYLQSQAASLDTLGSNIKSMQTQIATTSSDTGSQMTDAEFLRQVYFPAASDIEKGIDQLNFLADQSGVIVSDVQVEDFIKKTTDTVVAVADSMQTSADLLIAQSSAGTGVEEAPVAIHRTYVPDTFMLTIETAGSYEATKDFYARLIQAKRFFFPKTVELADKREDIGAPSGTTGVDDSTDILFSTMEIEFLLLPTVSLVSAVGDDAFEKAKLDFETLATIRQNQQGVTPELPAANPLGKTNLFVK